MKRPSRQYISWRPGCPRQLVAWGWTSIRCGDREWEDLYRRRWQYDKVVRSTHGVNCTGSCSWNVYVKDGIIVWETQKTDYPSVGKDLPGYEPRGCPRGATFSWYVYSPVRVKYPYVRSALLEWSGIEAEHRTYSPFVINIENKIPFRTLTGPAQFYLDHEWMLTFGEALPIFRPPLDAKSLGSMQFKHPDKSSKELVLNYLTPHSKWSIHSTYSDTLIMLTLFRGGEAIWINNEDAESIDVKDNDWVECYNANGVLMAKAVVSHRIPKSKAFMYHAQKRLINTPGSRMFQGSTMSTLQASRRKSTFNSRMSSCSTCLESANIA